MENKVSYKSTVIACYTGYFSQAIVVNLVPIIFIPLRERFGFSYSQLGLLILINFVTQILIDISLSKAADKYGLRIFAVVSHFLCVAGFLLFAFTPYFFAGQEFLGYMVSSVVFSAGGGLLEILLNPIIDAIPAKQKDRAMILLHSFYAWGQAAVVIITTLLLFFGVNLTVIILLWAAIPFVNGFIFSKVPIAEKENKENIIKIRQLIKNPIFIIAFIAILFGSASEATMAQWASSFMQKGLGLPKITGDILGICGFAVMLGTGRALYGFYAKKVRLNKILIYSSFAAVICYFVVAVSPFDFLSIAACAVSGLCVSLMWPGTLVIASERLPLAGASMFALLSAGGDIGAAAAPFATGNTIDFFISRLGNEQSGLRLGILLSGLFPLAALIFFAKLKKRQHPL